MAAPKSKAVYVTARVKTDMECNITHDALVGYAVDFISSEGFWEDFIAFILRSELGNDIDSAELTDTDLVIP